MTKSVDSKKGNMASDETLNNELRTAAEYPGDSPTRIISPEARLQRKVDERRHSIVAGPPGTGKTKLALDLKDALKKSGKLGCFQLVQFHENFSYQAFVEGYAPDEEGFAYKKGVFQYFLEDVRKRRKADGNAADSKIDLFVIDEINRADVSSVFGELLTYLDDPERKNVTLPLSRKPLQFFGSVVVIGTMNTADRSIALLDFALRRRFAFIFVPPDYEGLTEWLNERGFDFDHFTVAEYVEAARRLNIRIKAHPLLGKGMTLGQALFVPKKRGGEPYSLDEVTETLAEGALPQLEAYLGLGAQRELDKIVGPDIRRKIEAADQISNEDIVGLVRILSAARDEQEANA